MELAFSQRTLKLWYYRYKDSPYYSLTFFGLVFVISFVLIWKLVYPQIMNWFSVNAEIARTQERIKNIDSNILALSQMNDVLISQNLEVAAHALPTEKDFIGILLSISQAAQTSQVSLDDYSVVVGDLVDPVGRKQKLGSMQLKLNLGGGIIRVREFLTQIQTSVPLAEIANISSEKNSSEIVILFYYKPLSDITLNDTKPLKKLTTEEQDLLKTLDEWWEKTKSSSTFTDVGV